MNKIINLNEIDEQKLPKDQDKPLFTEMNGEFENIDDLNMKKCDPESKKSKISSVGDSLKKVVKYGNRTSEFGSTTGHCYKSPVTSSLKVSRAQIESEEVNNAKLTYRYGKQDKVPYEGVKLGVEQYMVKGFRDVEPLQKLDGVFGYNESSLAGFDIYEKDAPMVKKTKAGYTSLNQL